jgi:glutamate carboxypeptidase
MTAQDERAARELIDESTASVAREHDVTMHIHGGFGRPPKPMDVKSESLFAFVRQCGAELNLDLNWRDTGGVCDGNNIAACGVPVVDTMGARGGAIHSADEFLIVDSLPERARLSALVLLRLAEGGQI